MVLNHPFAVFAPHHHWIAELICILVYNYIYCNAVILVQLALVGKKIELLYLGCGLAYAPAKEGIIVSGQVSCCEYGQ